MRRALICGLLMAGIVMGPSGCCLFRHHDKQEKPVTLSQVPAPARNAIDRLTAGGKIEKIDMERKGDTVIYDVEAQVAGKHVEYDVDSSGRILASEESVEYGLLPAAVRAAAEKYFGSGEGLKASKEVEEGKAFYEVEGKKGGATAAVKLTDTGAIVEEEKD